MGKSNVALSSHGKSHGPSTSKKVLDISCHPPGSWMQGSGDGSDPSLTPGEIKTFRANLKGRRVRATKFYHEQSMLDLGIDHCLKEMFSTIGWRDFLNLSARTYEAPTIEFLSSFARDDQEEVLTFKLQGQPWRLTYEELDTIMGTHSDQWLYKSDTHSDQWIDFKRNPNLEFWHGISGLSTFDPHAQRDICVAHPCWKIAHRLLSTSVFGKAESSQINTVELYFLYCMSRPNWSKPEFSSFFLDKCDLVRTRNSGDIYIGGLITLIGLGLGLQFPESEFVPVRPPGFLLDRPTLVRMNCIRRQEDNSYIWYHDQDPVFIMPHPSISAFSSDDRDTWFLPEELNFDAVPNDDIQMLDVAAYVGADNSFEAEDHFDHSDHPTSHSHRGQSSGAHFETSPQFQPHPQHHPEEEPEFPLNIYSQLAALRLQGNRNEASIRSIQEQQARDHSYLEDLWYHFQPEGGYPPRGPPQP